MEYVLSVCNLTKCYAKSTPALQGINLQLPKGQIIGLLGPNGSGKTTLLKMCAGLLTPSEGAIEICGIPVGLESKALVSYLPDRTYLGNGQTVQEQLDYFQDFYEDFDCQRAQAMLQQLNIDPQARFGTLSKGNREKVQLILVMSRRAKLYLLDEPIGGVDPATRDYILNTIVSNYDPEATVLISTHLIADVESVLDSYIFLHEGKIVRQGLVDDLRQQEGMSVDEVFREVFKCLPNC